MTRSPTAVDVGDLLATCDAADAWADLLREHAALADVADARQYRLMAKQIERTTGRLRQSVLAVAAEEGDGDEEGSVW